MAEKCKYDIQEKIKVYYGVRIRKIHQNIDLPFRSGDFKKVFNRGDLLLVKTSRGEEIGEVVLYPVCSNVKKRGHNELYVKQIIRKAEPEDLQKYQILDREEEDMKNEANSYIQDKKDVRIFAVEMIYDRNTAYVYYKNLNDNKKISTNSLKPLAEHLKEKFKMHIDIREKGGRGEAKQLGGVGVCGEPLCCATHLAKYRSVSVKAMKKQNLTINTYKMSGPCTKLQCCMNYEVEQYET